MVITEQELEMGGKDVIDYWTDKINADPGIKKFTDIDSVKKKIASFRDAGLLKYFSIDGTGIFAYMIVDDLYGGKCFSEIVFYILPKYRGKLELVSRYIEYAEALAIDKSCIHVKIGTSLGYKQKTYMKLLERWGYETSVVSKKV